ncbi:MAG: ComF family protein [Candidatus Omnitrophica bacterium]|nr:ComF family protein [Candidatus Omnitrophota bacterium]
MIKVLKDLFIGTVDLIYPFRCVICQNKINIKELGPLCFSCFYSIQWNHPPFCSVCGRSIAVELIPENICVDCKTKKHFFNRAWSVALYEGVMRECIRKFKYERYTGLVYFFGKILNDFIAKFINIDKFDYVLPIPLHPTKLREREFNQALLLAYPISKKFSKALLKNIYRVKFTLPQSELNAEDRLSNIKGAFKIKKPEHIRGKNILIIDDILTTGSTVDECAKLLKSNGANLIEVLTLAC